MAYVQSLDGDEAWWLWAKSDAGGRPHSLPGHLLDSGAVAELIWSDFLSSSVRATLDEISNGRGRDLLVLLAAWHDLGKATPAFQAQCPWLIGDAEERGLKHPPLTGLATERLRHGNSGSLIAERVLTVSGAEGFGWLLPIIAGHHGSFLFWAREKYRTDRRQVGPCDSAKRWVQVQEGLSLSTAEAFGIDICSLTLKWPGYATQLALAGFVSMADWIASSSEFEGTGLGRVNADAALDSARSRADQAWRNLGLDGTGHWEASAPPAGFRQRFGFRPNPLQLLVDDVASNLPEPGLVIVEAPMGEGKTEAALAAIEVLVDRFGLGGFAFAMPTQGTTDAMYGRVDAWLTAHSPSTPLALVHGKAMANEAWRNRRSRREIRGVCDDDPYGHPDELLDSRTAPQDWLLGRHRALLSPAVVATIDHLLFAATHIKYVSLRYAGLVGKVLVIDEVHSYDVFMAEFLQQLLRWCQDAGIPVLLMSATLPEAQRRELISAYANGLPDPTDPYAALDDVSVSATPGYPLITSWTRSSGVRESACSTSRPALEVRVLSTGIVPPDDIPAIADLAATRTADGGVALVILNTVRRAQEAYVALRDAGVPVVLLHGRLTTGERASRTRDLLARLGRGGRRPARLVVVATQIAEQSFDVDADVLITDLAPIDLLLQRVGRLHRHSRADRAAGFDEPTVLVTGLVTASGLAPTIAPAFEYVYDRYTLMRAAAVLGQRGQWWAVPGDVPSLVAAGYSNECAWPAGWAEAGEQARIAAEARREIRKIHASAGLLGPAWNAHPPRSLDMLHSSGVLRGEDGVVVRDGEPSEEVALVVQSRDGQYTCLDGTPLGPGGVRAGELRIALRVLKDTVRMRTSEPLLEDESVCRVLDCWRHDVPLLGRFRAVVLDADRRASGPWGSVSYHDDVGLVIERKGRGA